jgi:hypothetical protein
MQLRKHSIIAAVCASVYALPFWLSRKLLTCAVFVLYLAVVQNSRKWKVANAATKNESRHNRLSLRRRSIVRDVERARAMPRRKAREAMPESEMGCPG